MIDEPTDVSLGDAMADTATARAHQVCFACWPRSCVAAASENTTVHAPQGSRGRALLRA